MKTRGWTWLVLGAFLFGAGLIGLFQVLWSFIAAVGPYLVLVGATLILAFVTTQMFDRGAQLVVAALTVLGSASFMAALFGHFFPFYYGALIVWLAAAGVAAVTNRSDAR